MRFSVFHELGRHPILAAGNEKSRAYFWDLQRLEEPELREDVSQSEGERGSSLSLPRNVRQFSSISNHSSVSSTVSSLATNSKQQPVKEGPRNQGIGDPFSSIKAHKVVEIPKYSAFAFRQFSWSRDGQWCVGVGDSGLINVFHRWEKGVPPIRTDGEIIPPHGKEESHISK